MAILADCPNCHRKQGNSHKRCISCNENLDKAKRSGRVKYWIQYRVQGKQRLEQVGYSIEDAKDAEGKRRGQKRDGKFFEMMPDSKITFNELTKWWLSVAEQKVFSGQNTQSYYEGQITRTKNFNAVFGDYMVNQIAPADLQVYQATRKKVGKSDSYIDQELGTVAAMIKTAFENEKVSGRAYRIFKNRSKLLKKGANSRDTILTYEQYLNLMGELAKHIKPVVATGFWTGMRFGEIRQLTWDMVDLKNRVIRLRGEIVKERKPKVIPLSKTLQTILAELPNRIRATGKTTRVFTRAGKPVESIRDGLSNACERAGIPYGRFTKGGFIFHDLRHTAKTFMRRAGVDKNLRSAIFGHSNPDDMDLRYDRIDNADLIDAIDKLENYLNPPEVKTESRSKSDSK
jgi:integrase